MPSKPWPLTTSIEEIYDPKIRRAADRAYDIATLAATKAMLHVVDNSRYPIGTVREGFGLERAFLGRLNALPRQKRDRIVSVLTTAFREGTTWRRRYGKLARVTKFERNTPIAKQVETVPYITEERIAQSYFPNMEIQNVVRYASTAAQLRQQMLDRIPTATVIEPNDRLDVRINKVLCLDETGVWPEAGSDEISLGGTVVDCTGTVTKKRAFEVDTFNDGDKKVYRPPKVFHTFDLLQAEGYPKAFMVMLVLAEVDLGGVASFLNKLVSALKPVIANELAKMTGVAIGAIVGGLLGPIVAAVLAIVIVWVVGKIVSWLKEWWGDDIFPPFSQLLEIPSLHYTIPEDVVGTANFVGHSGHYQVHYSFRMYKS